MPVPFLVAHPGFIERDSAQQIKRPFKLIIKRLVISGLGFLALLLVVPQGFRPEERNPLSRLLRRAYDPVFAFAMRSRSGGVSEAWLWARQML